MPLQHLVPRVQSPGLQRKLPWIAVASGAPHWSLAVIEQSEVTLYDVSTSNINNGPLVVWPGGRGLLFWRGAVTVQEYRMEAVYCCVL